MFAVYHRRRKAMAPNLEDCFASNVVDGELTAEESAESTRPTGFTALPRRRPMVATLLTASGSALAERSAGQEVAGQVVRGARSLGYSQPAGQGRLRRPTRPLILVGLGVALDRVHPGDSGGQLLLPWAWASCVGIPLLPGACAVWGTCCDTCCEQGLSSRCRVQTTSLGARCGDSVTYHALTVAEHATVPNSSIAMCVSAVSATSKGEPRKMKTGLRPQY